MKTFCTLNFDALDINMDSWHQVTCLWTEFVILILTIDHSIVLSLIMKKNLIIEKVWTLLFVCHLYFVMSNQAGLLVYWGKVLFIFTKIYAYRHHSVRNLITGFRFSDSIDFPSFHFLTSATAHPSKSRFSLKKKSLHIFTFLYQ